jgi:hypothetical protein
VTGTFSIGVTCTPGAPVAWEVTVTPSGGVPFQKKDAEVQARAFALDPNFGNLVIVNRTAIVNLVRA